ncbi:MAG: PTS sugar transporter subunit IIB [Anaerorhabdus sp.]|uniref:PTS sugar transporter subunit IIB n=1 Tax=Anaerorhabdus sp. TaxID=1872524 RepID=UPI002FCB2B28
MRILLACAMGMSTSIITELMLQEAKRQGNDDIKIWAVDQGMVEEELGNFDVLLLAPQVQHTLKKMKRLVGDIPVAILRPQDYGRCDGVAILKFAMQLFEDSHFND